MFQRTGESHLNKGDFSIRLFANHLTFGISRLSRKDGGSTAVTSTEVERSPSPHHYQYQQQKNIHREQMENNLRPY